MKTMTYRKIAAFLLLTVLFAAVLSSCSGALPEMAVEILSTGDSDCIIIRDGSHTVFIDTADGDDYRQIYARLTDLGISHIDAMILTHYDNDHIGSAAEIVRDFDVDAVYGPDYVRSSAEAKELDKAIAGSDAAMTKLKKDTVLAYGDMIFGVNVPAAKEYGDENDYSLIITLTYGGSTFIFLGDAVKTRMGEFNSTSIGTHYDVVKFPHHGDYFKALKSFVQFNPFDYGVSCVRNSDDVDTRLAELISLAGAEDVRTSDGAVTFISDGKSVKTAEK